MSTRTASRLVGGWCAVSVAVLALSPLRALRTFEKTDFIAFLTGARMLRDGTSCLYCAPSQASAQTALLGHTPTTGVIAYANPPLAAWLLQPIAGFDAQVALAIFLGASMVCLALAAVSAWGLLDGLATPVRAAVLACSLAVVPGAEAIAYGQWDPALLLAVVLALRRLRRGDDLLAGVILGTLWVKPQVVWLVVPCLLVTRSWRTVAGLAAGAAAWAVSGLALVGEHGVHDWWESIAPGRLQEAARAVGLPALAADLGSVHAAAFATSAALVPVALLLLWCVRGRLRPADAVALGLVLSVLLSPHAFFTDTLLFAPALLLRGRRAPAEAIALAAALGMAYLVDQALPAGAAHATALATALLAARMVAGEAEAAPRTGDQAAAVAA